MMMMSIGYMRLLNRCQRNRNTHSAVLRTIVGRRLFNHISILAGPKSPPNMMNIAYSSLHFYSVTNSFSEQFRNEELLDCTLNAEGGSIKVHKAILCAQSTLLEKMILDHIHIGDLFFTLDGVLFEDLKSVVEFMYEGRTTVLSANYSSFVVVAELLGMTWANRIQMSVDDDRTLFCNERVPSSSPESLPLCNITNVISKKRSKREKSVRLANKVAQQSSLRLVQPSPERSMFRVDKNAFCTALGLRKIQRTFRKSKTTEYAGKGVDKENMAMVGGEIQSEKAVYIEEKNLPSFLGAEAAEELCFRGENNIEIECDVSEMSGTQHLIVYDRNKAAVVAEDIVELREGNAVNAQIFEPGRP